MLEHYEVTTFCADAETQRCLEILGNLLQILYRYTVLLAAQQMQMQSRPHTVVHWLEIRQRRRPFLRRDQSWKVSFAPLLSSFRPVGSRRSFVEMSLLYRQGAAGHTEVPRIRVSRSVKILVNFHSLAHKNKEGVSCHWYKFHRKPLLFANFGPKPLPTSNCHFDCCVPALRRKAS